MIHILKKALFDLIVPVIGNPFVMREHFVPRLGLELEPYLKSGTTTAVHHLLRYAWAVNVIADFQPLTSIKSGQLLSLSQ